MNVTTLLIVLMVCVTVLIITITIVVLKCIAFCRTHPEVLPPKDEKPEKKTEDTPEYKERKEFIRFCYEMIRTKESEQKLKDDCWKILKDIYVPENTKQTNA